MQEGTLFDRKSLKTVVGKKADIGELAKDCVAFANAKGGHLYIGVEDDSEMPVADQRIQQQVADKLTRRINELTVNVAVSAVVRTSVNGGEYIDLNILPSLSWWKMAYCHILVEVRVRNILSRRR